MIRKEIYKAWAEVNVSNLRHNVREIKRIIGDDAVEILAVLKDDAYGHGLDIIAPAVIEEGINYIGVATVLEGKHLRSIDKNVQIVVFGCFFLENLEYVFDENLIPVVCSYDIARLFDEQAKKRNTTLKVHLMIDTGMGRVGVWHEEGVNFVKKVYTLSNLYVQGVCSHFSCADQEDLTFSREQLARFDAIIKTLSREGIEIPFKHIANSAGIVRLPGSLYNMVRPGIFLYGISPMENLPHAPNLKPVLTLKSWIVYLKTVGKGRPISYGRTYETTQKTKIATVSFGYGDGYNRSLSNKGEMLVHGKRARVAGVVTMDHTMLDVGHIEGLKVGDEVVLIGQDGAENIAVREVAEKMGSIPYEVICHIGRRVKRIRVE